MDDKTELLLREYEQCCENIRHNNTRLWSSAIIFAGSLGALVWLAPLSKSKDILDLMILPIGSLLIALALYFYLRFFMSLEYFDRVEYHRAVEIERELGYWRARYLLSARETPSQLDEKVGDDVISEAEKKKIQEVREKIKRNISEPNVFSNPGSSNQVLKAIIVFLIVLSIALFITSIARFVI